MSANSLTGLRAGRTPRPGLPISGLRGRSLTDDRSPGAWLRSAVILFALAATLSGVWGGPALGDHEALVAQCARNMRLSGDWIVPQFLETKFVRKTPLPYWMVAGVSYLFPNDPVSGLPVTPAAARLPSAICAFLTVLLLWRMATSMFGARVGIVTAAVTSSSIAILLYGPNATAEMPLAFGCTWAYFHFWFAMISPTRWGRFSHMMLFYLALGVAMLAKGPAPIALVGFPLAVWWFTHRPARILSRRGFHRWRIAMAAFVRDLGPRFRDTFTQLWFFPGMILFAATFIPWMFAVAARHPSAWDIWSWQYVERAQGDFPDTRHRGLFYYPPLLAGLVGPWLIFVFEAAIAPWVRRYARLQQGLYFAGVWMLMGMTAMAMMEFKKPYYILPAVPGLLLLVGVSVEAFFRRAPWAGTSWTLWAGWGTALCGTVFIVAFEREQLNTGLTMGVILGVGLLLAAFGVAVWLCHTRKRWLSFAVTAFVTVAAFQFTWHAYGHALDNIDKVAALAEELEALKVPPNATVLWADRRPDARLSFYFHRDADHMLDPNEIVKEVPDREERGKTRLERMAANHGRALLKRADPVYLIVRRKSYDRWKALITDECDVIGVVEDSDPEKISERDWLVLTNVNRLSATPDKGA